MTRKLETVSLRHPVEEREFGPDAGPVLVTTPQLSTREVFARFWRLTRGDRRWMVVASILLIAAAAADTVAILLFGYVVDHVLTADRGLHAFWKPAGAWAAITTLSTLVSYAGTILSTWVGERFVLRLRTTLHSQVASAAPDFLDSARLGDVLTRFTEDLDEVEALVVSSVIGLATALASAIMFSVSAIRLSPTLALLALLLAPVLWALTRRFSSRVGEVARAERANHSRMMTVLEESLANTALTRSSGRGTDEARRLAVEGHGWLSLNMRQARLTGSYSAWNGLLEMFAVIGVLGVGTWQISHHAASVGVLLAFSAYLGYLYPPLHSLAGLPLTAAAARASASRITELQTNARPVPDTGALSPTGPGRLSFVDVSFTYPGRAQPALAHFDLIVAPGETIAITGASGAGKSTVAKLLARDYDPSHGVILLDGIELPDYRLEALRASMTVLAQETLLFDATLADNIGYARPGASRSQVEAAARNAGLTEFVASLPDGLDTRVGQRGRLLSGGQRQRVAIARAFLRDAPLLILDEPTTGLDHESATELLPTLRLLAAGRTTLLITHDQRLTYLADRLVTVDAPYRRGPAPLVPGQATDVDLNLPSAIPGRPIRPPRAAEPVPADTGVRPPRKLRRTVSLVGLGGLLVLALGTRVMTQQGHAEPRSETTPSTSAVAPATTGSTDTAPADSTTDSTSTTDQAPTTSTTTQHATTVLPRTTTPTKAKPTATTGTRKRGTTGTSTPAPTPAPSRPPSTPTPTPSAPTTPVGTPTPSAPSKPPAGATGSIGTSGSTGSGATTPTAGTGRTQGGLGAG